MITANDLVKREVFYCVSSLVSTLANNGAAAQTYDEYSRELGALTEQAQELCYPLEDWEEPAREEVHGWSLAHLQDECATRGLDAVETATQSALRAAILGDLEEQGDWQDFCDANDIEPYQRDVFEHWIVSDWLADKLAEKGEKVDKDFVGLTVWARTTTGQGIASDWVIEQIVADLNKSEG
ncbi:MAG: hypothetical protein DI604_25045 [Delftia acidovorans]|nr:MAG: hypothetical protein DI604_25045 [Delftia acidovorans]